MGLRSALASTASIVFNWLAVTFLPDSNLAKQSNTTYYVPGCDWSSIQNEEAIDEVGKRAISERDTEVIYKIGRLYYQGYGSAIAPNPYKAVDYFTQAADYGEVRSMYMLGLIYANRGESRGEIRVGTDLEKAVKFFELAAHRGGHVDAMYELGHLYAYGIGDDEANGVFVKDIQKSISYFEQAEQCGHIDALYELGRIYECGSMNDMDQQIVLPVDTNKAIYYYQLADREGGHIEAKRRLNMLCPK